MSKTLLSISISAILSVGVPLLPAQVEAPGNDSSREAKGQDSPVNANSRVKRLLQGMLRAESCEVKESHLNNGGAVTRLNGKKQKRRPTITKHVRFGQIEYWERGGFKLARSGARWVERNADKGWTPMLAPRAQIWKSQAPRSAQFLAERLLLQLDKTNWKLEPTGEIDSRPVRKYTCTIDEKHSKDLTRSGALPGEANNPFGALVALRVVGGLGGVGGAALKSNEAKVRYELELYEDPRSRLPARIVARVYTKGGANMGGANVIFKVNNIGGNNDDEDEEEEEEEGDESKKKEKAQQVLQFDFSEWGSAEIDDLVPEAGLEALKVPQLLKAGSKAPKKEDR